MAGILQHDAHLQVEVLVQIALQVGYRFAAQAGHNGLGVAGIHMVIKGLLGIDSHQRAGGARPHAAGFPEEHFLAAGRDRRAERVLQLVRVLAQARQVHADVHFKIEFLVLLGDAFRYLFELFDRHSTAHLSSRSSICSADISPATSPSNSATGARLQAPTQRAVIRLMFPSFVVCP